MLASQTIQKQWKINQNRYKSFKNCLWGSLGPTCAPASAPGSAPTPFWVPCWLPKTHQIRWKNNAKINIKNQCILRPIPGTIWAGLGVENGSKLAPKNGAKYGLKVYTSWDRLLEGFWMIFWRKMDACWNKIHSKINANFETRFIEKTLFFLRKNNDFECLVGLELAIKTNEKSIKNELKMGRHRGIKF